MEDKDLEKLISNKLAYYIEEVILSRFPNSIFKIGENKQAAYPHATIQWWYDQEYNRVYVYFEISNSYMHIKSDIDRIYFEIASKIRANFYKDIHIYEELLDPSIRVFKGERVNNNTDSSPTYLRPTCFSYWYCDGTWRFVESKLKYDMRKYESVSDGDLSFENLEEFEEEVQKINIKYNLIPNPSYEEKNNNIKKAFEDYKILYKQFFDKELIPIPEDEICRFSVGFDFNDEGE